MCTSFTLRPMSILMSSLIGVLLELNLYIVLASSLSVVSQNQHVRHERLKISEDLYGHPQPRSRPSQPAALVVSAESPASRQQPPSDIALRDNKVDDLFLQTTSAREQADDDPSHEQQQQHHHLKQHSNLAAYNSISLDNSLEVEPEMLTNNHQIPFEAPSPAATNMSNIVNPSQNSRHYSNYQGPGSVTSASGSSMQSNYHYQAQNSNNHHHHKLSQSQHYGKYSPNMFANNYNLNYIHGFLTNKPSLLSSFASSTPSSAPPYSPHGSSSSNNANSMSLANQYNLATQPMHQQTGGFVSSYISASSALSAAVNSLQQTIAQKQQQLASISNQLQNLASGGASSYSSPGRDSFLQLPSNSAVAHNSNNNNNNNNNNNVNTENIGTNEDLFQGASSKCGRQQVAYREPRVVGGNNTYEGEFPWAVSIQRHGNHHCGGVIVDRRWILTAAHCVRSQLVGNLAVRIGGHTLSRSPNGLSSHLEKDYQVEQIVMHDDFSRYDNLTASQSKSSANTNNADIALLKLKHDILWNDLAWPVCFPERDAGNFSGHDAIVIGWGKLNEKSEEFSNELQKVKLTIIDNKVCQNWFRQAGRDMPIDDRIICAGFKHGGKDACHGDSGGPLLSRINGQYVVVGVVSTGIGCARPLLPGLYSRVSSYISWIERYITT